MAKQFLRFKVGDGSRIFMWLDVGTRVDVYLTNMAIELYMMQGVVLMQSSLQSFEQGSGIGLMHGQISWWIFKVNYMKW